MNFFYVYILQCNDRSYYVGHTDNIEARIVEHQIGKYSGYTSTRLPVACIYTEIFATRDEAFEAERKIKGWSRNKKEALVKGDWNEIIKLSNT